MKILSLPDGAGLGVGAGVGFGLGVGVGVGAGVGAGFGEGVGVGLVLPLSPGEPSEPRSPLLLFANSINCSTSLARGAFCWLDASLAAERQPSGIGRRKLSQSPLA